MRRTVITSDYAALQGMMARHERSAADDSASNPFGALPAFSEIFRSASLSSPTSQPTQHLKMRCGQARCRPSLRSRARRRRPRRPSRRAGPSCRSTRTGGWFALRSVAVPIASLLTRPAPGQGRDHRPHRSAPRDHHPGLTPPGNSSRIGLGVLYEPM